MTNEEKSKEYAIAVCVNCKKNISKNACNRENFENCCNYVNSYFGFYHGYKAGLAEGRKESLDALICEQEYVEMMEKDNTELKEKNEALNCDLYNTRANLERITFMNEQLEAENAELKAVCDYNCPDHKLATHNACLTCPAVRNSPYHDLKNVSDEELQQIIKDAETEMEM